MALLDRGADVNIRDNDGRTALYWACRNGLTEVAKVLILHGAEASGDVLTHATYLRAKAELDAEADKAFSSFKNASAAHDDDDD